MASGAVVVLPRVEAATPAPLFEELRPLDRFPDDARKLLGAEFVPTWEQVTTAQAYTEHRVRVGAIAIPEVRQLWEIYFTSAFFGAQRYAAVVRDLDTLDLLRTIRFEDNVQLARATAAASSTGGGEWSHAVDAVHGRLFLLTEGHKTVLEVDLETFAVQSRALPAGLALPVSNFLSVTHIVGGMTYDPYRDDLLLLYGGPQNNSAANTNTFLYTLDLSVAPAENSSPAAAATALRHMRSCTAPVMSTDAGGDTYNWDILVTEAHLYVPCSRVGHTAIVVRTTRSGGAGVPPEDVVAGPVYAENALADQQAERIVMTTYTDKEIWTFEASTMSFVGIAATGPSGNRQAPTGYGLDRATGRVFFQSPNFGLGVVEARFFPLPQARRMPERLAPGRERILSDARTNRIFVLEGTERKARSYRIYRVPPAPTPPPPPEPDRNTADVAEKAGVTEARFNASGSGYGARVVWANGFATVPPAPVAGTNAPTAQLVFIPQGPACQFTDREVVAGRVFKAEYDTGSTAAEAAAVDVDGATKQDLDKPSRCEFRGNFRGLLTGTEATTARDDPKTTQQETRWGWERAGCATSEGNEAAMTDSGNDADVDGALGADRALGRDVPPTGQHASLGPSSVSCPLPGGTLTARAEAPLGGGDSPVTVGRAWTTTEVQRLPGSGAVRSVTESTAQDVRLTLPGLVVTFAEVRSRATSTSNGRPVRGPMSSHEVSIRGAVVGGESLCGQPCGGADLGGLVGLLNTAAAGRALFRTGTGDAGGRDAALLLGSPKGAQTAVQKSAARQASDRALTGDYTVEVPGLEVTTFNDNTHWGRARQLYQFAGVASSATYNVVLRPTGLPVDLGPFDGAFGDVGVAEAGFPATAESFGFDGGSGDAGTGFGASPAVSRTDDGDDGGGFWAPLRAVARGLRLFLTDPRHALLLLTAWALLGLPGALSRRRRLLTVARNG